VGPAGRGISALDDDEFRGFVAAREGALLRTAYMLTGDQQLAEDLVQTALEKAAAHWRDIRVSEAAEAYVRRILYRERVSFWRRRRVTESLPGELPERPVGGGYEAVEDRMVLRQAMSRLGRRQRTVLVMRFYEDMTERQVAEILGVSVGTVKSQAAKALRRLREECGDRAPVPQQSREERP
jgi:RNA polymerase sigma-70 factor (sigma-E family)